MCVLNWRVKMKISSNKVLIAAIVGLGICILLAISNTSKHQNPIPESQMQYIQEQPEQSPEEQPEPTPSPQNYEQALKISQTTGKRIFLFFKADWCGWCKKMKQDTLSNAEVKKALATYVVYHVNTDRELDTSKKYKVSGIPACVIITGKEKVIKKKAGYMPPKPFLLWLN